MDTYKYAMQMELDGRYFYLDLAMSQEKKIDMRMAAWMFGISRIAEAQKIRGLCP